jgi:hypothetical protein
MHVVAFEIVPGYHQPMVRFAGDREEAAARLWARCFRRHDASFRVVDDRGEEFGTVRPGDVHGLDGIFTERCGECAREFRTAHVGAVLCPGCELMLTTEERW